MNGPILHISFHSFSRWKWAFSKKKGESADMIFHDDSIIWVLGGLDCFLLGTEGAQMCLPAPSPLMEKDREEREMPSKHGPKFEKFYHTKQWMKCRTTFVALNHGKCQICGKRGNLVHHRTQNVNDPYISLNFDNLELLCRDCHNKIHADHDSGSEDKPTLVEFTPDGNVIVREKK